MLSTVLHTRSRRTLLALPILVLLAASLGQAGGHTNKCCVKPTLDLDDEICPSLAGCMTTDPCEPGTLVICWNNGGCRAEPESGLTCGPASTLKGCRSVLT